MTMLGKIPWNKGKKMPHTSEWEAVRLAAVRQAATTRVYLRGYARPDSATAPMLAALAKARLENPEKYAALSIKNLPKSTSRGKPARTFRAKNAKQLKAWRKAVLARDGEKCKQCSSTIRLEAHHIIPLSETKLTAFLVMNGVTLCRECHKKTASYAGRALQCPIEGFGNTFLLARTIPHAIQAYETCGNYSWTEDGLLVIFISDMQNEEYEGLVLLHEYVEAVLVKKRGISVASIDKFDMDFEQGRDLGDESEPGDSHKAPYFAEHQFATMVEKMLAVELGVDWDVYDQTVLGLSK